MGAFVSVASRHIYNSSIGRGLHITSLDASVGAGDPRTSLASIFGVPSSALVDAEAIAKLGELARTDPHVLSRRRFRGPWMEEWMFAFRDAFRERGDRGIGLADLVRALLWGERSSSDGLPFWYPATNPELAKELSVAELSLNIAFAAMLAASLEPPEEIKTAASELMSYHVPFGLSPETKSNSLEELLAHANYAAVVPLVLGLEEIAPAVHSHEWLLALQATATTGASIILIISSVAVAQLVVRWLGRKGH